MRFNSLNAEQEVLLEQLELPEDISIQEVIERLESLKIEDKEYFEKSFWRTMTKCMMKIGL